jgi:hypothetical protein
MNLLSLTGWARIHHVPTDNAATPDRLRDPGLLLFGSIAQ